MTTTYTAPTVHISTRQLAESAYRALRVVGVPSGVADDGARDTVELQATHGRGLEVLDRVLHGSAATRGARCRNAPDGATGARQGVRDRCSDPPTLDARGGSALLIAVPLVALLDERRPLVAIRALAHPAALAPELRRRSGHQDTRFELYTATGAVALSVEGGRAVAGPAWDSAWSGTHDMRLRIPPRPIPGARGVSSPSQAPIGDGLEVESAAWKRLHAIAARYLV